MLEPVTTSSASPTDDRRTPPRSRWFKGLLLGLLLTMAALLLWQLRQEFAQQLQHQHQRSYDYVIAIRSINSVDAVTAQVVRLPWELLETMMERIVREVDGVCKAV